MIINTITHSKFKIEINQIFKLDKLTKKIDLKKYNDDERELLKLLCYTNQQLNFCFYKKKTSSKTIYFLLVKLHEIYLSIKSKIRISTLISLLKKKKELVFLKTDIVFLFSHPPKDHKDTLPLVNAYKKKLVIVDVNIEKFFEYKKLFKNTKIINIQDYIGLIDYFLAIIKSIKFLRKFLIVKIKYAHPLLSFNTYVSFFVRDIIYKKILKKTDINKVFIDRQDGLGNSSFISNFKKLNKKKKIYGYSLNGLALNNDLISSHYLFSNIDYLFCYGKFDKIFLENLYRKNKFKLLQIPKKIIPVGSIRNYSFKLNKIKKLDKTINFLYIKSNSFIYNNLDHVCFKKFCFFVNKNFPNSKILVKEKNLETSKSNNFLIEKNIIHKKNIYTSTNLTPEKVFEKADIIVGTTSAALAQAIYYNKPVICLDNKIIISSFLKYFCSLYIESIYDLEKYKNDIYSIIKHNKSNKKIKNYIFKKVNKNPYKNIFDIINKQN